MNAIVIPALGLLTLLCAGTSGCSSTKGIRPIQPANSAKVADLQPTLAWEASINPAI